MPGAAKRSTHMDWFVSHRSRGGSIIIPISQTSTLQAASTSHRLRAGCGRCAPRAGLGLGSGREAAGCSSRMAESRGTAFLKGGDPDRRSRGGGGRKRTHSHAVPNLALGLTQVRRFKPSSQSCEEAEVGHSLVPARPLKPNRLVLSISGRGVCCYPPLPPPTAIPSCHLGDLHLEPAREAAGCPEGHALPPRSHCFRPSVSLLLPDPDGGDPGRDKSPDLKKKLKIQVGAAHTVGLVRIPGVPTAGRPGRNWPQRRHRVETGNRVF